MDAKWARVPLQHIVNSCIDEVERALGLPEPFDPNRSIRLDDRYPNKVLFAKPDHFAFISSERQYFAEREAFGELLEQPRHYSLGRSGGFITVGKQQESSQLSWRGKRFEHLALVGCETQGIVTGYAVATIEDLRVPAFLLDERGKRFAWHNSRLYGQPCIEAFLEGQRWPHLYRMFFAQHDLLCMTAHLTTIR